MWTDTHAHLTSADLLPRLDGILARAQEAQIEKIINVCTDPQSLEEGFRLETGFSWIKNAGATTPHDVAKDGERDFEIFSEAARLHRLIAVGETGLDYFYQYSDISIQKRFFVRYLHLAAECQLPVIIHCRDAFDDLFAMTDHEYSKGPAILHCFTGSLSDAEKALKRGWMISFSGILTFTKSHDLRGVARMVPLSSILIETDTPSLAPQSKRGHPNEPSFLVETAECLAKIKEIELAELSRITNENARRIFRISE